MRSEKKNPYRATRKEFLQKTALVAAGALFLPAWVRAGAFARFGIAGTFDPSGAPAPSGTLADTAGNAARVRNIGIQLYTVRKEMLADPLATLQQLAKIGFKELESARSDKGNYYGLGPKEIKKICSDLGMRLRSGHVHADKDFQQSIDQAAETGQEYLIASVLPSKGQTIEHYQESAEAFNKLGEQCRKSGLVFGYHNHDSEFESVNGTILYDVLLERADPSLVKMEMDLGWVVASGHDPLHYFSKYPGRFPLWHLKDMDPARKTSTEFGKGQVDIKGLLQHAGQSGMRHFFLEQEEYTHTAFESIEEDYTYLSRLKI